MQLTKILDVKNVSNKQLHLTLDGANFDGVPRNVLAKGRVLRKEGHTMPAKKHDTWLEGS